MDILEKFSRIAGILSLIVGIIGLFLIKPVYSFFTNKEIDKSTFKNNSGKVALTKNGDNFFNENVTNNVTINMDLSSNKKD
ncbi:MAG: hypothetical protein WC872_04105 [Candidatus Absconditabacterales bacterium]